MEGKWAAVTLVCTSDVRELIVPFLWNAGATGFVEEEESLVAYFPARVWHESAAEIFSVYRRQLEEEGKTIPSVTVVPFEDKNWNEEWEKSIGPVQVTDRIVIRPSWAAAPPREGAIVITIDPKMSFGTGYHETTRIMLRMLEKVIARGDRVLDVGTGTGVLAIAAVFLGAASSAGVDNDEWAYTNALENVRLNGVRTMVDIRHGSIGTVTETDFSIVMANIHYSVIVEMLDELLEHCTPGGYLLLSGFLGTDLIALSDTLHSSGCSIDETICEAEWAGITARKILQ